MTLKSHCNKCKSVTHVSRIEIHTPEIINVINLVMLGILIVLVTVSHHSW